MATYKVQILHYFPVMIKTQFVFKTFVLLSSLLIGLANGHAVNNCAKLFSFNPDHDYARLGVDIKNTPLRIREILDVTEAFLISPHPPSFETLRRADLSRYEKTLEPLSPTDILVQKEAFVRILELFKFVKDDSDYFFIGNGMYIPYLMAKSLFENTPLQSRIKFIAFSRPLAKMAVDKPGSMDTYYNQIGVGINTKRNIVVIDSVSLNSPGENSIIRTATSIADYLIRVRDLTTEEALALIFSIGIKENNITYTHESPNLSDYSKRMRAASTQASGLFPFENNLFPFLSPMFSFNDSPFRQSYERIDADFYWNGKFDRLDSLKIPRGQEDVRYHLVQDPAPMHVESVIGSQAGKAHFYLDIIGQASKWKTSLKEIIDQIVERHQL